MPYDGEFANKASHFDLLKNPDVRAFLADCDYLRIPSDEEGQALSARFSPAPATDAVTLPANIIAVDGSRHESNIDDRLPNTRIG